jgi:hypothetical protein
MLPQLRADCCRPAVAEAVTTALHAAGTNDVMKWGKGFLVRLSACLVTAAWMLTGCAGDTDQVANSTTTVAAKIPVTRVTGVVDVTDSRPWATADGKAVSTSHDAVFRRDGGFRTVATDRSSAAAWEPGGRTFTQWTVAVGGGPAFGNVETNTAMGRPDIVTMPPIFRPVDGLVQYALAAAERSETATEHVTAMGRSAIKLSTELPGDKLGPSADRGVVVVDEETELPLSAELFREGQPFYSLYWSRFDVATGEFGTLEAFDVSGGIPPGATVARNDQVYVSVERLGSLTEAVGYDVFTGENVPEGYSFTRAAVRKGEGLVTGAEGSNPNGADTVSVEFRIGWHSLVVTNRRTLGDTARWSDPFGAEGLVVPTTPIVLRSGPLVGAEGESVVAPGAVPYV